MSQSKPVIEAAESNLMARCNASQYVANQLNLAVEEMLKYSDCSEIPTLLGDCLALMVRNLDNFANAAAWVSRTYALAELEESVRKG